MLGFEPLSLQKDITNVYLRSTDWATKPFRSPMRYELVCYNYTANMNQTLFPYFQ